MNWATERNGSVTCIMQAPTQLEAVDCVAVFGYAVFVSYYTIQKLAQSRSCSSTQES
jgi:hypothetical protein